MIRAVAIDDEPKAIKVIEHHLLKIKNIDLIAHFNNAENALIFLKQNPIDLIFLDINMPNKSGLEMLKELKLKPHVIFTTAYAEFALESYNHDAIDYLLKPFEFERFLIAIQKVKRRINSQNNLNTYFFLKDGFKNFKIEYDSILFIKGSGNYLDVVTKEKIYSSRMTFLEIIEKLPSTQFIRIHQSYIINIKNTSKIENNQVSIESYKIPISGNYKDLFLNCINN
ncbi:response regulator transcription factor [Tamlana sp. 2201CG12-4]|uniref:LytR/AlgR family response regulator transcription factor n=1 Tax=Tamlana sp. 2201CG12-4 TaxID=3112582 RepID=UPI002DBCC560|nr:response regulator transcription factor [Tamlana sp. 2201CG12-4]MEC3908227.1 response regulator transcription factor [Tamlana sp. 2201CG12-4]